MCQISTINKLQIIKSNIFRKQYIKYNLIWIKIQEDMILNYLQINENDINNLLENLIFKQKTLRMQQPKFLILGGSSFMGKSLVDHIYKNIPNSQVHLINRGKKYWNNQVYKQHKQIKYFYGDRNEHKQMYKAIRYLNQKLSIAQNNKWNAVIDFTSFKWRDLQSVTKELNNLCEIYVFISTDSLYNNTKFGGIPITQQMLPLEKIYAEQKGTKISDKYGYDKLKCELYLRKTKHVPYLCLRLPDVLGPYDNTNRLWCTIQWVKHCKQYPIQINQKDITNKLSFVSSTDISKFIMKIINNRDDVQKYRSYNLCFLERVTNLQFVQLIGKMLQPLVQPVIVNQVKQAGGTSEQACGKYQTGQMYFPSTNYTCIDCSLAIKQLNWNPTPLSQCIKESIQFFQKKGKLYENQYKEMKKQFKSKIIKKE